jgi:hypothetical protein
MSRTEAANRLTPWLVICAFCITLSGLALRDRLDRPAPLFVEAPQVPMLVLSR